MAKKYLATISEISRIIDGDLGVGCTVKFDWTRGKFTVDTDRLLRESLRIEFPCLLERDVCGNPIIPGGTSCVRSDDINRQLLDHLGVKPQDNGYLFSVTTGRFHKAHDGTPAVFQLAEPRGSRHLMLMASWPKEASAPTHQDYDALPGSTTLGFAFFDNDPDYNVAVWMVTAGSGLARTLRAEAQEIYRDSVEAGIAVRANYDEAYLKHRQDLWDRVSSLIAERIGDDSTITIVFHERHISIGTTGVQPTDIEGSVSERLFYDSAGISSVMHLVRDCKEHIVLRKEF